MSRNGSRRWSAKLPVGAAVRRMHARKMLGTGFGNQPVAILNRMWDNGREVDR